MRQLLQIWQDNAEQKRRACIPPWARAHAWGEQERCVALTILNTSVLTAYGSFLYEPITLEIARAVVAEHNAVGTLHSAVGHAATAELLTDLLGVYVPVNRVEYVQATGEVALVCKVYTRPPEGTLLSRAEIEVVGYSFGFLWKQA